MPSRTDIGGFILECGLDCDGTCVPDEPACSEDDHDWTSDGMGGCRENPGVQSLGGTKFSFAERCRHCGMVRTIVLFGSQRNACDCDSVEYTEE